MENACSMLWTGSVYGLFVELSFADERLSLPPNIDETQVEPLEPDKTHKENIILL